MSSVLTEANSWRVEVDEPVVALAASKAGHVAVVGAEGSLTLMATDGSIESQRAISQGCLAVAWSPRGNRVAVGSVHGVDVFDASGATVGGHHEGWCSALAWSGDGDDLAAAVGRTAVVLDHDGVEQWRGNRTSTVTGVAWVSRRLATAAYGGVHVHDVERPVAPEVLPFTGSLLALSISPNRRWVASGNQDATLHVWRFGSRDEELAMSGYPTKINALAFSPDSTLLAAGGSNDVTVWAFTGKGPKGTRPRILRAHQKVVTSIAWSSNGELLAAAAPDGQVAVWKPRRGKSGHSLAPIDALTRDSPATAVSWDGSGRLLAGWADSTVVAHVVDRR